MSKSKAESFRDRIIALKLTYPLDRKIMSDIAAEAISLGLVVVVPYSDDGMVLYGSLDEEIGSYDGVVVDINSTGLIINKCENDDCPNFIKPKKPCKLEAVWTEFSGFTYQTHGFDSYLFEINEDDETYGMGAVFELASIPNQQTK